MIFKTMLLNRVPLPILNHSFVHLSYTIIDWGKFMTYGYICVQSAVKADYNIVQALVPIPKVFKLVS